jgi:uncharacterized SAM-binding protein YcdF (DUF218 family)
MFFVLSKILIFLLNPWIWFFALLITGLILKNKKFKKIFIISSFIVFYIFSNKFLFNSVINLWQIEPIKTSEISKKYDYGIVLGGLSSYEKKTETINFNEASDRLLIAVQLFYQNKIDKILITSGSGNLINNEVKEADILKEYLLSINFPEENLIIENQSANTYENAKFTAEIIGEKADTSNILLFTSAMHMKRALACFQKQGIYPDIFVVDYLTGFEDLSINFYILPKFDVVQSWQYVFKEIIGYYVYKIKKYA